MPDPARGSQRYHHQDPRSRSFLQMLPHQVQDAAAAGTGLLQLGSGHTQGTSKVKQTGVQRRPVTSAEPPCLAAGLRNFSDYGQRYCRLPLPLGCPRLRPRQDLGPCKVGSRELCQPMRGTDADAVRGRRINCGHDRSGLALRGTSTDTAINVMAKPV